MSKATFTKLSNGDWAVRIQQPTDISDGAAVVVTKKSGDTKTVTISHIISRDDQNVVYAIKSKAQKSQPSHKRRARYVPCGYPGCSPHYCDECDGAGRYG